MHYYYHTTQAAIDALPTQALHQTVVLPDGSVFSQVYWEHEPNGQAGWEARADVHVWGSLLESSIPAASAQALKQHGVAVTDSCHGAVKKMIQRFGGMRLKV